MMHTLGPARETLANSSTIAFDFITLLKKKKEKKYFETPSTAERSDAFSMEENFKSLSK